MDDGAEPVGKELHDRILVEPKHLTTCKCTYVTDYYKKKWSLCLTKHVMETYEVVEL